MQKNVILLFLIQLFAFWPVWRWYVSRLLAPSDDPAVVIALGTVGALLLLKRSKETPARIHWGVPTSLLVIYVLMYHFLPPLLRAVIAVTALSYTLSAWRFGKPFQPWIYGLLWLSLPVIPLMQIYLGYPLRIIVGKLSAGLLRLTGFPVLLDGIAFSWRGELIWLDELCSGTRKLWAGLYYTFSLLAFYNFRTKKTFCIIGFSLLAFIAANVLRTSFLFYVKAELFAIPECLHQGGGLIMFLIAAIATTWFVQRMGKGVFT